MNWFPKSKPRETDGGLEARSRRGDIGEKWWSRKFVEALETGGRASRRKRGKRYARDGQVLEIEVETGEVEAAVQGSQPSPYTVRIGGNALDDKHWEAVLEAMAERASFAAGFLAGEMPADIEEAFEAAGTSLFPGRLSDLETRCSCPDSAATCKHIAAVVYLLAEKFDDDPFLILRWRGRRRDRLLDELRARRGPGPDNLPGADREPLPDDPTDFWQRGELESRDPELESLEAGEADSVLERLGAPPHELEGLPERLAALYEAMTSSERD